MVSDSCLCNQICRLPVGVFLRFMGDAPGKTDFCSDSIVHGSSDNADFICASGSVGFSFLFVESFLESKALEVNRHHFCGENGK